MYLNRVSSLKILELFQWFKSNGFTENGYISTNPSLNLITDHTGYVISGRFQSTAMRVVSSCVVRKIDHGDSKELFSVSMNMIRKSEDEEFVGMSNVISLFDGRTVKRFKRGMNPESLTSPQRDLINNIINDILGITVWYQFDQNGTKIGKLNTKLSPLTIMETGGEDATRVMELDLTSRIVRHCTELYMSLPDDGETNRYVLLSNPEETPVICIVIDAIENEYSWEMNVIFNDLSETANNVWIQYMSGSDDPEDLNQYAMIRMINDVVVNEPISELTEDQMNEIHGLLDKAEKAKTMHAVPSEYFEDYFQDFNE